MLEEASSAHNKLILELRSAQRHEAIAQPGHVGMVGWQRPDGLNGLDRYKPTVYVVLSTTGQSIDTAAHGSRYPSR